MSISFSALPQQRQSNSCSLRPLFQSLTSFAAGKTGSLGFKEEFPQV